MASSTPSTSNRCQTHLFKYECTRTGQETALRCHREKDADVDVEMGGADSGSGLEEFQGQHCVPQIIRGEFVMKGVCGECSDLGLDVKIITLSNADSSPAKKNSIRYPRSSTHRSTLYSWQSRGRKSRVMGRRTDKRDSKATPRNAFFRWRKGSLLSGYGRAKRGMGRDGRAEGGRKERRNIGFRSFELGYRHIEGEEVELQGRGGGEVKNHGSKIGDSSKSGDAKKMKRSGEEMEVDGGNESEVVELSNKLRELNCE